MVYIITSDFSFAKLLQILISSMMLDILLAGSTQMYANKEHIEIREAFSNMVKTSS